MGLFDFLGDITGINAAVDFFGGGSQSELNDYLKNPTIDKPTLGNTTGLNFNQVYTDRMGQAGPKINTAPQDQFRQKQMGFVDALTQMSQGQGPSMVQNQLQQATDQNIKQQMALAASGRGGNAGMAQRLAAQNAGDIQQQAAQQAAALRNQEMMSAYGALGNQLNQGRAQDIGLASAQGQLDLAGQAQKDNFGLNLMQLGNQRDINLMDAENRRNLGLLGAQTQGGLADLNAQESYKKRRQEGIGTLLDTASGFGQALL